MLAAKHDELAFQIEILMEEAMRRFLQTEVQDLALWKRAQEHARLLPEEGKDVD